MKISTRGRYALIFMVNIITKEGQQPVSIKEVAKKHEVSDKYLEQLVTPLVKSGLVQSVRGVNGGYFLKRRPEDYTVGEILRVVEGDLAPAPCVEKNALPCKRRNACANVILWEKLNDAINSVVDNITLADMYRWQEDALQAQCESWSI